MCGGKSRLVSNSPSQCRIALKRESSLYHTHKNRIMKLFVLHVSSFVKSAEESIQPTVNLLFALQHGMALAHEATRSGVFP